MPRQEREREDLMAEATALVERVELQLGAGEPPLVIGFRRDGAASLFVGGDPVFQFNRQGQLRRGYVGGRLIKAEAGRLVALTRRRQQDRVELLRHELDPRETAELLARISGHLEQLGRQLEQGDYQLVACVPPDVDVVARVRNWLSGLSPPLEIAATPRVG